jgi:hypothetical protein
MLDACVYDIHVLYTHANPCLSLVWVLIKKLIFTFLWKVQTNDIVSHFNQIRSCSTILRFMHTKSIIDCYICLILLRHRNIPI